jgi:hypothetical protein
VLSATTFCSFLREFSPIGVCAGGHLLDQECADGVVPSDKSLCSVFLIDPDASSTEPRATWPESWPIFEIGILSCRRLTWSARTSGTTCCGSPPIGIGVHLSRRS